MSLIQATAIPTADTGFTTDQSLRFDSTRSTHLERTMGTPTNADKWVYSGWHKQGDVDHQEQSLFNGGLDGSGSGEGDIQLNSSEQLYIYQYSGGYQYRYISNAKFRDPSAWYHIVVAVDTTQATASNRVLAYVNGELITSWDTEIDPSQNLDSTAINTACEHRIGNERSDSREFDGYIAETHFIDGMSFFSNTSGTANSSFNINTFGETGDYGEWKPKEVTGVTYGNNGFHLPFKSDYEVEGFSAVTYGGNAVNGHYIGGTGFSPDLTWIKERSSTSNHQLHDKIRGAGTALYLPDTSADDFSATTVQAFNSDGFTVGSHGAVNASGDTYVAWNWDMGADTPTGFGCVTYKGNDDVNNISGVGFQPDLVWTKGMDIAEHHCLFDAARGHTVNIKPNLNDAEAAQSKLDRFDKDGFTLSTNSNEINDASSTYVAWCWDMGGSDATNTSGSINSTVRANTDKGQSIVTWTGTGAAATIGHGLSSTPELIILKNRSEVHHWGVFHKDLNDGTDSGDYNLFLNLGADEAINENYWNDTVPTSSVFSVGNIVAANGSADEMVAYCFHSVTGYSSIGSYTGNGNATGPSVTTGFRPAFVMLKKVGVANWFIFDNTRSPFNTMDKVLQADHHRTEAQNGTSHKIDFNATGFQLKASGGDTNDNNVKYRYIAFAGGADAISTVNTTGTIDSRVKASTTYGQSMVSWTGTGATGTVGTGLTSDAEFVIVKNRDTTDNWSASTTVVDGSVDGVYLNAAGAFEDWSARVDPSSATSNTIGVYDWDDGNKSGSSMIAYAFHSVTGYSKIGSYTGDGGSSHTITTGFKPAWVMIKNTSVGARPWVIFDGVRSGGLVWNDYLKANESEAETVDNTNRKITVSDTGFTLGIDAWVNENESVFVYIAFADKREYAYWLDQSGNNNDWTSYNLTESDIIVDSPTNNFCTWNPLFRYTTAVNDTYSEGNLKIEDNSGHTVGVGTIPMTSGKWYWEVLCIRTSYSASDEYGMFDPELNVPSSTGSTPADVGTGGYFYAGSGWTKANGTTTNNPGSQAYVRAMDIIAFAYDVSAGTLKTYVNNILQKTITVAAQANYIPSVSNSHGSYSVDYVGNFGQDSSFAGYKTSQGNQDGNDIGDFYYPVPANHLALCTSNLPTPAVTPSEHFNTLAYDDGEGAKTGVGFQPDLVWFKSRGSTYSNQLYDSVRGVALALIPDTTGAEYSAGTGLTAFGSDGFTIGVDNSVRDTTGDGMLAWCWKAGSSVSGTTSGSGDDTAYTGSVNTDAGFSIIRYGGNDTAGHEIPHHLGVIPDAVLIKNLTTQAWNWYWTGTSLGATKVTQMNNVSVAGTVTNLHDTMPTSSVVYLGTGASTNASNDTTPPQPYMMYCWKSIEGYSKIGEYTGNDDADGAFVYTGFKPAYVMIRNTNNDGEGFVIFNNKSDPFNVVGTYLTAYSTAVEQGTALTTHSRSMDFVSNGFKIRGNSTEINDGEVMCFIAFAETPFKYATGK